MLNNEAIDFFLQTLQASLSDQTFVRLTLSRPATKMTDLKNIYARIVHIKSGPVLSFTLRYATKDVTQNHSFVESVGLIGLWLGHDFLNGDLYTTQGDFFIQYNKKRQPRLYTKAPSHTDAPPTAHDLAKKRPLETASDKRYLHDMGISGADGRVLPSGQKKFRQINKYIEIIDAQLQQTSLPLGAHVVDMGSGKGYLTFALYDYLTHTLGLDVHVTGIEIRPELVAFCNELAHKNDFQQLQFIAQNIQDFQPTRIDVLIALHACDTATDLAIAKGIKAGAQLIIVAPCCHKQIRKQMQRHEAMQPILRHGILEERQAELLTDGMRALILEAEGYKTKVFEFVSTEHTNKNLMITALKHKPNPEAPAQLATIKQQFGIAYHYLEHLLES